LKNSSSSIVPLARLSRLHGIPRRAEGAASEPVQNLKADLFHVGGELFRDAKDVFVSLRPFSFAERPAGKSSAGGLEHPLSDIRFERVSLAGPCKPHGGSWGRAAGVLLPFAESALPAIGCWVGLPREALPPLRGKEFYVCDVLDRQVVDEQGRDFGRVTGFADVAATLGGSVNFQARAPNGALYEFPAAWVTDVSDSTKIIVPEVGVWVDLDPHAEPDDREDS
jgi:hypothetical protein